MRRQDYATPPRLAELLFGALDATWPGYAPRTILEPCAGAGALVSALRTRYGGAEITAVEQDVGKVLEISGASQAVPSDFLAARWSRRFDLVVMNPPFKPSLWRAFVNKALTLADVVAVLGPSSAVSRVGFDNAFRDWPCDYYPIAPRPSFTGNPQETGRSDVAWYVWHEGSRRAWRTLRL